MNTANIRPEDVIEVDIRGRRFVARVRERARRELVIDPLQPGYNWHRATSRQVIAHWAPRPLSAGRVSTRAIRAGDLVEVDDALARVVGRFGQLIRLRQLASAGHTTEALTRSVRCHFARRGRVRAG